MTSTKPGRTNTLNGQMAANAQNNNNKKNHERPRHHEGARFPPLRGCTTALGRPRGRSEEGRAGARAAAVGRHGTVRRREPFPPSLPEAAASAQPRAMFVRNGNAAVRARGFPKSNPKTGRRAVWAVNPFAYRQQCCFAASRAVGGRACCCSHVLGLVSVAQVYSR